MKNSKIHLRLQELEKQKADAEKANRDNLSSLEKERARLSDVLTQFDILRGERAKLEASIHSANASLADYAGQIAWLEALENSHLESGQGSAILQYHRIQPEAGAERAHRVVERWLQSAKSRLAALDREITGYAEKHGIQEVPPS